MSDGATMGRTCSWCSAVAADEATTCPSCGAALAQRESLGELAIPGVTSVDPALQAIDGKPMRLGGPSPSQGAASGVMAAAVIGGPIGLVALGGIAAVAAAEYAGAGRGRAGAPENLADIGRFDAITALALEQIEKAEKGAGDPAAADAASPADTDPWRDDPGRTAR
jgi:hypothetical protein